jgi:hypothetical protein
MLLLGSVITQPTLPTWQAYFFEIAASKSPYSYDLHSVGQQKKIDSFFEWKNSREHDRYQQPTERKRADGD